jgi:hypothetical protein
MSGHASSRETTTVPNHSPSNTNSKGRNAFELDEKCNYSMSLLRLLQGQLMRCTGYTVRASALPTFTNRPLDVFTKRKGSIDVSDNG